MNNLFDDLFGPDYCQYEFTKTKHCVLVPGQLSPLSYNHDEWEKGHDVPVESIVPVPQSTEEEVTATVSSDQASASFLEKTKNLTRGEITSIKLPGVVFIAEDEVQLSPLAEMNDPTIAVQRPSEATVEYALTLLAAATTTSGVIVDNDDEQVDEVTVKIGRLGTYTKKSLQVFQSMCQLSAERTRINDEKRWLFDTPGVCNFLMNAKPRDEVVRHGQFLMDVSDFSSLACERYVNGFSIDVISFKLLERSKPTDVIYLPSFSQIWAKQGVEYFKHRVSSFFQHCPAENATCILTPLHFESPEHWGLLCFNVPTRTVYFDDGLKIHPPIGTLPVVQNMLSGFRALSGNAIQQEDHWNNSCLSLPLPRINMPIQTKSGVGAGSCGVGVILAIRDIIAAKSCFPSFNWSFDNMTNLRKELMALILQWRSEEVSAL